MRYEQWQRNREEQIDWHGDWAVEFYLEIIFFQKPWDDFEYKHYLCITKTPLIFEYTEDGMGSKNVERKIKKTIVT